MEKISDNNILKILEKYENIPNTEYAIMIDGEWGCGKTYFIKHKYIGEDNKKIYISLYGIKSCDEIDKKIYYQILEKTAPKNISNSKFFKASKAVGSTVLSITNEAIKKAFNISIDSVRDINPTDIISLFKDISKYTIVFDDLERSEISIVQLLGYINQYVEHKNMKIILIANEKEILKKKMYANNEVKYLVAANSNVDIPIKEDGIISLYKSNNNDNKNDNKKISVNDLKERSEKIFGEDLLYKQIKEKLVGNTIYYYPNLEEVIEGLISERINNDKIKKYLDSVSHKIVNIMENRGHINIRTLKIALQIIDEVLSSMFVLNLSNYDSKIIEDCKMEIVRYTVSACIDYKEGKTLNSSQFDFFSIDDNNIFEKGINGFKFIDDIITKSYGDIYKTTRVIKDYLDFKSKDTTSESDPINLLKYYWEQSGNQIETEYFCLVEKLEKDNYKKSSYIKIIYRVFKLTKIGFPETYLTQIISIIDKNLSSGEEIEEFNQFDEYDFVFSDQKEREEFYNIIEPIKNKVKIQNEENSVTDINSLISNTDGWGQEFANYCIKNKNKFLSAKNYFGMINIENLITCLSKSSTKDISDFRRTVMTIYNYSNIKEYYSSDLENLKLCLNKINELISKEEYEQYDNTKKYNINWIEKNIEETIKELTK